MLASLGMIYFKYWQEKRKKRLQARVRSFETDQLIYMKLQEMIMRLQADRIYIGEYSRSNKYWSRIEDMNSLSAIRGMSVTYEVVTLGTSAEQHNMQNLPVVVYSDTFQTFVDNDEFNVPNVDELSNDENIKKFIIDRGIKSLYSRAMYSLDGTLLGALSINYVRRKHELTDAEKHYIRICAEQLAGYM